MDNMQLDRQLIIKKQEWENKKKSKRPSADVVDGVTLKQSEATTNVLGNHVR
jgi:hypothetical protein